MTTVVEPEDRTAFADLAGPVPVGATGVGGQGGVQGGELAGAVDEDVAEVAAGAVRSVVGLALVGSRHADVLAVEVPVERTLQTAAAVPGLAANIGGMGSVGGGEDAGAVDQVVSNVATQTQSTGRIA